MKYKSEALAALHENALSLYKVGGITEARMREYDEMCLKNPKTKKQVSPVFSDDKCTETINREQVTA